MCLYREVHGHSEDAGPRWDNGQGHGERQDAVAKQTARNEGVTPLLYQEQR